MELTIILFLGLFTYDEFDPSPFSVGDEKPNNLLGAFGANFSSILFFILIGHIYDLKYGDKNIGKIMGIALGTICGFYILGKSIFKNK